jgi:tol-pal system protein YbgF
VPGIEFRGARPVVAPPSGTAVPPKTTTGTPQLTGGPNAEIAGVLRLQAQVDELEALVRAMTGQLETLQFTVRQTQEANAALKRRLDDMEAARALDRLNRRDAPNESGEPDVPPDLVSKPIGEPSRSVSPGFPPVPQPQQPFSNAPAIQPPLGQTPSGPVQRPAQPGSQPSGPVSAGPVSAGAVSSGFPANAPQGSLGRLPASALPGEAGPLFATAKARLTQGDYAGAEQAFARFIELFGDDPAVPEAQHWLGDALRVQRLYPEAAEAYRASVLAAPQSPIAPESLAKLVTTLRLMGEADKACPIFAQFQRQYPNAGFAARGRMDSERALITCR